jgi:hypothetical protein
MHVVSNVFAVSALLSLLVAAGGCTGNAPNDDAGVDAATYYPHVATIVNKNCVSCHQAGGIAPFALETYEQVKSMKDMMRAAVEARTMPPSPLDVSGDCSDFKDRHYLTDDEIATIARFAEEDAPEGDPSAGAGPTADLATLAAPNVVVTMAEPYTPNAAAADDYRCFVVDPALSADQFLTGAEVVPGDSRVVHHVLLFAPYDLDAENEAVAKDTAEAGPGFTCFGDAGVPARLLHVWAPGAGFTAYPEGTGLKIDAGRKLVLQVHYNTLGGAFADQTSIKLQTTTTVASEAFIDFVLDDEMLLPADASDAAWSFEDAVPFNLRVYGVFPHMHTLGRTMKLEKIADGVETCIADVPRWDFHWQRFYFFEGPIAYDTGDVSRVSCTFDTRGRTEQIAWGEGTQDEMCLFGVYYTID